MCKSVFISCYTLDIFTKHPNFFVNLEKLDALEDFKNSEEHDAKCILKCLDPISYQHLFWALSSSFESDRKIVIRHTSDKLQIKG